MVIADSLALRVRQFEAKSFEYAYAAMPVPRTIAAYGLAEIVEQSDNCDAVGREERNAVKVSVEGLDDGFGRSDLPWFFFHIICRADFFFMSLFISRAFAILFIFPFLFVSLRCCRLVCSCVVRGGFWLGHGCAKLLFPKLLTILISPNDYYVESCIIKFL